jgi:pimeloyl-ACP methyl ester carboxylesterase
MVGHRRGSPGKGPRMKPAASARRRSQILCLLMMTPLLAMPKEVSFPTEDGGVIHADLYGSGHSGIVLAHGMRFDKGTWKDQATRLAKEGYLVLAIDFRGYGKSHGGPKSQAPQDEMYLDVLGAVKYLRQHGANTVSVIGASMGGRASADAVVHSEPKTIDRLILLSHAPIRNPERITGPKFFATAKGDPITPQVLDQYAKAPEPKELLTLEGSAHAQFLFTSDQGERLMNAILRFLSGKPAVAQ